MLIFSLHAYKFVFFCSFSVIVGLSCNIRPQRLFGFFSVFKLSSLYFFAYFQFTCLQVYILFAHFQWLLALVCNVKASVTFWLIFSLHANKFFAFFSVYKLTSLYFLLFVFSDCWPVLVYGTMLWLRGIRVTLASMSWPSSDLWG